MSCWRLNFLEWRGLKKASRDGRRSCAVVWPSRNGWDGGRIEGQWRRDSGTRGGRGRWGEGWKSESWGSVCHWTDRWGSWKLSSSVEQCQEARKAKGQPAGQWERVWSTNQNWRNKNKHSISPYMRQREAAKLFQWNLLLLDVSVSGGVQDRSPAWLSWLANIGLISFTVTELWDSTTERGPCTAFRRPPSPPWCLPSCQTCYVHPRTCTSAAPRAQIPCMAEHRKAAGEQSGPWGMGLPVRTPSAPAAASQLVW